MSNTSKIPEEAEYEVIESNTLDPTGYLKHWCDFPVLLLAILLIIFWFLFEFLHIGMNRQPTLSIRSLF